MSIFRTQTVGTRPAVIVAATVLAGLLMVPAPAATADPPAPACQSGYVWRGARPGDGVCVTPQDRDITAQENAAAPGNVQPNDGNVCKPGFVWRNAYDGDAACVTPDQRSQAAAQNAAGASHTVTAATGCQKWRSPGPTIGLGQNDGYNVSIAATAQTLGPQATFSGGGKPDVNGTVVANQTSFVGNKFVVAVNWSNGWGSTYKGTINPDGTATGNAASSNWPVDAKELPPPDRPLSESFPSFHVLDKFICDQ